MAAMPANAPPGAAPAPAFDPGATQTLRTEFIAFTGNDELLEQLGLALDGDCAIRHCETMDDVAAQLSPRRAHVVMVDSREQTQLGSTIEGILLQADSCVVVVFAPAEQTTEVAGSIRGSAVFAVLPIPVETDKTAAVLAGARDEALSRLVIANPPVRAEPALPPPFAEVTARAVPAPVPQPAPELAYEPLPRKESPAATPEVAASRRRPSPVWAFGASLLAMLVVAAVWLSTRNPDDAAAVASPPEAHGAPSPEAPSLPATATSNPVPAAQQDGSVEELLIKAQAAFRNRRYTTPAADNALAHYQAVLAQQPGNGEAREGLQRIRSVLDSRLQAALGARDLDDAAEALAQLELIDATNPALPALKARFVELQIAAALDAGNMDRAGQMLRDATQAGQLPADRATQLRSEFERRQADARTQRQAAEAARRQAELRAFDPDSVPGGPVARTGTPTAAADPAPNAGVQAADPAGAGPTTDRDGRASATGPAEAVPAKGEAPAAAAPPPAAAVRAVDFKRTRYVEPVYPRDALEKGLRGEVRLRITVDPDGRVQHAEVLASSPAGVFEDAAVTAVRRWRFKPIEVDGRAVEASATTTVVFRPAEESRR